MNLTITQENSDLILSIDLPEDFKLDDFKSYIESETNIKPIDQSLLLNNVQLDLSDDSKTLKDLGINNDDLLLLKKKQQQQHPVASSVPSTTATTNPQIDEQCELLRSKLLANKSLGLDVSITNILKDKHQFKDLLIKSLNFSNLYLLNDIPNISIANQSKVVELISQAQIDESLRNAYEYSPESFGSVFMLFINCELNNTKIKVFVDSGAQMTIISPKLAEQCGLTSLIDRRFIGEARGVGSSKILGRIHSAPLKIEDKIFPCTLSVLDSSVDMLLGLDMLKRYQASIDLKNNRLVISDVQTRFLDEHEIPKTMQSVPNPQDQASSIGGLGSGNIFSPGAFTSELNSESAKKQKTAGNVLGTNGSRPPIPPPAAAATTTTTKADPEKVTQLVNMGFGKQEATMALIQCNNNLELAAGLLFD